MGQGGRQQCDWSTVEVDRRQVDSGPNSYPTIAMCRSTNSEGNTKQYIDELGATVGCPGSNTIKDNKRAQAHSDRRGVSIEECLRVTL